MRNLLLLLIGLLLGGCAIKSRVYVPPTDGERAHFRLEAPPTERFIPAVATFEKGASCTGRYWMQFARPSAVTTSFVEIRAGVPFSAVIHYVQGNSISYVKRCTPVVSFLPLPGRYYRATLTVSEDQCLVALESSASPQMTAPRHEQPGSMRFSNGLDENSSFCSPS